MEICESIGFQLQKQNHFEDEQYNHWISSSKKSYKLVDIRDDSRWTLLIGKGDGRYIHIHPARYSAKTMRIRALPFKTATMLLATPQIELTSENLVESINYIRKLYFNEPPVKDWRDTKNIQKIAAILRDSNNGSYQLK